MVKPAHVQSDAFGDGAAHTSERATKRWKLLAWKRHKRNGLYELYKDEGSTYFVRRSQDSRQSSRRLESKKAIEILANVMKERDALLTNELLKKPYAEEIDGIFYDTSVDEIWHVGDGDATEAAAIYRTRDGNEYMRLCENNENIIWPLDEDLTKEEMRGMINFWFNMNPSFQWFVDIVKYDGQVDC